MEEQINQNQEPKQDQVQDTTPNPAPVQDAPKAESTDIEKNKIMAIIGYILPILFFVPLLNEESKNDSFAKFHVGQQLNLLIFWIAAWVIASVLSVIFAITIILIPLIAIVWLAFWIAILVFMIKGIMGAANGDIKPLPLIGGFKII